MSTRSSIYYHEADHETDEINLNIHIYAELGSETPSIRMEIELPGVLLNIKLPEDMIALLGIGRYR